MRETAFFAAIGIAGGAIANALGGWDYALQALVSFMTIDYVTGWIAAAVFKKSKKSESGALDSSSGYKGILKKCMMLLMVIIANQLDVIIGWNFLRYAVIIALISNELVSVIENAGLMGVPIPGALRQAIGILNKKEGIENKDEKNKKR